MSLLFSWHQTSFADFWWNHLSLSLKFYTLERMLSQYSVYASLKWWRKNRKPRGQYLNLMKPTCNEKLKFQNYPQKHAYFNISPWYSELLNFKNISFGNLVSKRSRLRQNYNSSNYNMMLSPSPWICTMVGECLPQIPSTRENIFRI